MSCNHLLNLPNSNYTNYILYFVQVKLSQSTYLNTHIKQPSLAICVRVWENGPYGAKNLKLRYSKSLGKFILLFFVFCIISLSDPYSTSMPNFKCQINLKDPKRAVVRQATFYSVSFSKYNKRGMGGVSKVQLKKRHGFETIACTLKITSGCQRIELPRILTRAVRLLL